jgi:uncharacterized protein (TIGR02284 family)
MEFIMDTSNEVIVSILNDLLRSCKKGEQNYRTAAGIVTDPNLREKLIEYSEQKKEFAGMLEEELRKYQIGKNKIAGVNSYFHKTWFNLVNTASVKSEKEVIEECFKEEDNINRHYQAAVQNKLPAYTKSLLLTQFGGVKEALFNLNMLRMSSAMYNYS